MGSESEGTGGEEEEGPGEEDLQYVDMSTDGRFRLRPSIDLGEEGYGGRVTTKAAMFENGGGSESDEEGDAGSGQHWRSAAGDDATPSPSESDESGGDDADDADGGDGDFAKEFEALRREDAQIMSKTQLRTEDDRERGLAIVAQRKIWEKALNVRIRVQKLLAGANKMPQTEEVEAIKSDFPSLSKEYEEVEQVAKDALQQLVDFQTAFSRDAWNSLDDEEEEEQTGQKSGGIQSAEEGWKALSDCHDGYMRHVRDEVDRWQRKTMLTSAGAKRGNLRALTQSISTQVRTLMEDPALVARRTHIAKNSENHRVLCSFSAKARERENDGEVERASAYDDNAEANLFEDEYDCETYEDAEFYQQILKEFLESQSLTAADIARAKSVKRRKVVDRKASKGRKIRYHVHEKLVNFMVPTSFDRPEFAEKLFGSLFAYKT
ncbi:apoptosis antagonizing transcription factor [Chloropicon primus]|nr:apoptosis antagonizing transcription factor [Chloropicon primus]